MKKITRIPSKKIAFKNVPVMGIFFVKRSLYTKVSVHEAIHKRSGKHAHFEDDRVVRFIPKDHEQEAKEIALDDAMTDTDESIGIKDVVEIKKLSVVGRVISVDGDDLLVQYKHRESIQFSNFKPHELKKVTA